MTVSADQIKAAEAKGLINVEPLAKACEAHKFPFYLACVILDKETRGRNIFGHDAGGVFYVKPPAVVEVTEERYKQFLTQIGAGKTSNGVGPMQLTFKGYHIGPKSLAARGLKGWVPADTMLYGVEILADDLKRYQNQGMSLEKAFWQTARNYNNSDTYADDAVVKARTWAATVGSSDMEVSGLEINSKIHANARHVTEEVLEHFPAVQQIWTYATFPDHNNCRCTDFMITITHLSRTEQVKLGDAIAHYLIANADRVGLNWLIWNRRIYRHQNTDRGHGWADYTGPKPHTDHVHMEVDDRTYQPPEDDMPTADEIEKAVETALVKAAPALAKAFLTGADVIPAGKDEPDKKNTHQVPATFIKNDHDLLLDILDALKKLAPPTV